jgi:hypothetical protein
MTRSRKWLTPLAIALIGVGVVCCKVASPAVAAARASFVFPTAELRALGLGPSRASTGSARHQLESGLPRTARAVLAGVPLEASAGREAGRTLAFDAFLLGNSADAARVLTAWRKSHRAAGVAIGSAGEVWGHASGRRAVVEVLWRYQARLGLVSVTSSGPLKSARAYAVAAAGLGQQLLRAPLPTTAWAKVLARVGPDGRVSTQTALEAFALAIGPLPGVKVPSGPHGTIESGDLAVDWALALLPKLSPELRRAIDRDLGLRDGSRTTAGASGSPKLACSRLTNFGNSKFHPSATLTAEAKHWAAVEGNGAHLDHQLGLCIVAGKYSEPLPDGDWEDSLPVGAGGAFSEVGPYCWIRVTPGLVPRLAYMDLAHEVFHCFEFNLDDDEFAEPGWVSDGLAEWASDSVNGQDFTGWISGYLTTPATELFDRTYDAVGFWGHVQDIVGGLWRRVQQILDAHDPTETYIEAVGPGNEGFLDTWGSSLFNGPGGGSPWEMVSPVGPQKRSETVINVLNNNLTDLYVNQYATGQYWILGNPNTPLIHVQIGGPARLSQHDNYTDLRDAWFCTDSSCTCPPGTTGTPPASQPLPSDYTTGYAVALGVTGLPESNGTFGTVDPYPLSEYCHPEQCPLGPAGAITLRAAGVTADDTPTTCGIAGSYGDPHMTDFNGDLYDFQAAGEFTLLKSTTDDFEVQVRQQPVPRTPHLFLNISVNTAAAMRVGRHTVEVDGTRHSSVMAYVDGHLMRGRELALAGGGRVEKERYAGMPAVLTAWPDGSRLVVYAAEVPGQPMLYVRASLTADRARHVEGLLGNWSASSAREFVGRNGHAYPPDLITGGALATPDYRVLYKEFGASWRITQRESLFHYAPGQSTRTYTIVGFPRHPLTVGQLTRKQRAFGERACKAITNPRLFTACVVDVGATDDVGLARADAAAQVTSPSLHPILLGAGKTTPQIAYDPRSRDTYVAWLDPTESSIDLCTLSPGATKCNGGHGPDRLVDLHAIALGVTPKFSGTRLVIEPGGRIVVLGEISGEARAADPPGYDGAGGIVAWSSPAGGSAFATPLQGIADTGILLAPAHGGEPSSGGAIALTGDAIAVFGWVSQAGAYPLDFADFTLAAPAPSVAPRVDPAADVTDAQTAFANNGIASVPDPGAPGKYIAVVAALGASARGCEKGVAGASGYGVGVGTPAQLQTQSGWSSKYFRTLSCGPYAPTLTSGPNGIGLLQPAAASTVYYRRFNTTTRTFQKPVLVSNQSPLPGDLSVSQDTAGNVYATWGDTLADHVVITYSTDAGASWNQPIPIGLSASDDVTLAPAGDGEFLLAYAGNGHEYLASASYSAFAAAN